MAELVTIARPYAEAAFKLAAESGNYSGWSDMLELIEAVVQDENIAPRIGDPGVPAHTLESVILGILGAKLDGHGRNLVQVLIQNGRLGIVSQIKDLYEDRRREHEGVVEAKIVAAMPLSDDQVRQLLATLEAKFGRKVKALVEIDPELLGGAKIFIGDKVIDATVRGRLDAMAAALAH